MFNPRLAFRTLFRSPFVTAVAVGSLALGIGANAAIFSLFDQMLLRPLPVQEPKRLVNLLAAGPKPGSQSCNQAGDCDATLSYPMLRDLERGQTSFTGIAAHRAFGVNLVDRGETLSAEAMLVSGSYFPVLGLTPALGRLLGPEDDRTIGANYVTVLSYSYWQSRHGSDPGVLNQSIIVNGQSMTIVGVAPRGFEGTTLGSRPRVFVPLSMRAVMSPWFRGFENRRDYWIYAFARLKPGVSLNQAQSALNGIYHPIINEVEAPLQQGMSDATMTRFKAREITLEEGRRGQSSVHGEVKTPLIMLFSITGVVLLIACANIANLLLARGASRSMEMAVRLSLGASRRQLLTQLLTESVLLALLGGAVSLLVARWTLALIGSFLPGDALTTVHLQLEIPVVLFAAGLSVFTGLLFGMFPALHSTRPDLVTTIRSNAGQLVGARSASRFRTSLATAQIGLSMALLISAGLFVKSLVNVTRVELGLRPDSVVGFAVSPALNGYPQARTKALYARIEEELAAIPGVTSVAASQVPVLAGDNYGTDVGVEGFKRDPDTDDHSSFNRVGPQYFQTLGIQLLAGREFTVADDSGAPNVAVVNQAFARKFNLGAAAVGKRMSSGGDDLTTEIIGLVQDAKYSEVKDEVPPQFFMPYRQEDGGVGSMNFYVRTAGSPTELLRAIPLVMKRVDPNLPLESLKPLPQQVRENIYLDRIISMLSVAFAVLATLLAAVGLYGVLAYTVAQRTREFGVRMALGADAGRVRGMVLSQVSRMTLIGGILGVAAAIGLGHAAKSLLFGLEGTDPLVIAFSTVLLTLVAFGAGFIPALRASRVQPMQALRYE